MGENSLSNNPVETDTPAPPAWFRGKSATAEPKPAPRNVRPAQRVKPVVPPPPEYDDYDERTGGERFADWFVHGGGQGVGAAVIMHVILFVILALIFIPGDDKETNLSLSMREAELLDDADMKDIEDFQIDLPEAEPDKPKEPDPPKAPDVKSPDLTIGDPFKDGSAISANDLLKGFKGMPFKAGKNAVRQGSFMAWTVPKDPQPGQNYLIHIVVKVPKSVKQYVPSTDLFNSSVVGTDFYTQNIATSVRGFVLRPKNGFVKLPPVLVPGASKLVKDTIRLNSRMLKEKQTLVIVF